MRPTLHNRVPSSALLKFLKLQSESMCFFSPNPWPGFIFDQAALRLPQQRLQVNRSASKSAVRRLSTTALGYATIEARFLNLDFLWPRANSPGLLPRLSSLRSAKWHRKLWGATSKKGGGPLQPDDLPGPLGSLEDSSDSIFSKGRSISAKAAAQPKLRCTELDENGNVVLASGEFKKSELIAKVFRPLLRLCGWMLILPL
jgi:magnesium transporter